MSDNLSKPVSPLKSFDMDHPDFNHRIRRIVVDEILCFSVLDIIAEFWDTAADAKYYWRDMKVRIRKQHIALDIRQVKLSARDKRMRLTDVAPLETCLRLVSILQSQVPRATPFISELKHLHPLVSNYLVQLGYSVDHHWHLPSGKEIDFLAHRQNESLIVECKISLLGDSFYDAVGQVICYHNEYGGNSAPALATFTENIDSYGYTYAEKLGIKLIEIPQSMQDALLVTN